MSDTKTEEEIKRNKKMPDADETHPGGLAQKFASPTIDPSGEKAYWKEKNRTRTHYNEGREYDDYAIAINYGWESAAKPENAERKFEEVETELETNWSSYRDTKANSWQHYRDAVRDAYNRKKWPK